MRKLTEDLYAVNIIVELTQIWKSVFPKAIFVEEKLQHGKHGDRVLVVNELFEFLDRKVFVSEYDQVENNLIVNDFNSRGAYNFRIENTPHECLKEIFLGFDTVHDVKDEVSLIFRHRVAEEVIIAVLINCTFGLIIG